MARQRTNTFEPNPPDFDDPVVQALQRQLFLSPDSNFWPTVNTFLAHMISNSQKTAPFIINKADPNFAHVDPSNLPSKGVTIGGSFFAPGTTDNCHQEVVTHEFFHYVVGLQHFYSTHETGEAMRCPHHLARAVFDIAIGQQKAPCAVEATDLERRLASVEQLLAKEEAASALERNRVGPRPGFRRSPIRKF